MGGCWGSNKPKAWPGPFVVRSVSRLGLSIPSNAAGVTPCCSFFRWSWQAGECDGIPLAIRPCRAQQHQGCGNGQTVFFSVVRPRASGPKKTEPLSEDLPASVPYWDGLLASHVKGYLRRRRSRTIDQHTSSYVNNNGDPSRADPDTGATFVRLSGTADTLPYRHLPTRWSRIGRYR